MPEITLTKAQATGSLPMVCMVTGEPATQVVTHTFRNRPTVTAVGGGPMAGLINVIGYWTARTMPVNMPMTQAKASQFRLLRTLGFGLSFGGVLVFFAMFACIVGFILAMVTGAFRPENPIPYLACMFFGGVFAILAVMGGAAYVMFSLRQFPRSVSITPAHVTLENVHLNFLKAMNVV